MNEATQFRVGGCLVALLIGLCVPAFLVGPALFGGVAWSVFSGAQVWGAITALCLGLWLFVVSVCAEPDEVKAVFEPFQAAEAVVLFVPFMLWIGTRGMWRKVRKALA